MRVSVNTLIGHRLSGASNNNNVAPEPLDEGYTRTKQANHFPSNQPLFSDRPPLFSPVRARTLPLFKLVFFVVATVSHRCWKRVHCVRVGKLGRARCVLVTAEKRRRGDLLPLTPKRVSATGAARADADAAAASADFGRSFWSNRLEVCVASGPHCGLLGCCSILMFAQFIVCNYMAIWRQVL